MKTVLAGYLRLTRPANLPTAAADILAGVAVSGILPFSGEPFLIDTPLLSIVLKLVASSVLLYAGGVVLNDVFDLPTDRLERPERPIPSGLVKQRSAAAFGTLLLLAGLVMAATATRLSGMIALILAITILFYNALLKKNAFLGPLSMGLCRSLNLLLGMSVAGELIQPLYAVIPMVYIFAITLISRGEVHGDNKKHIVWAGILYAGVIFTVYSVMAMRGSLWEAIPFLAIFGLTVGIPLVRAHNHNSPDNIRKAVISGVLSLIILDAALAAGFSGWRYGVLVVMLLPFSMALSKLFAVT